MASYDRTFEVVYPSLDRVQRVPLEVSDTRLLDPTNTAVVPLIDGEFVQITTAYKYARASSEDVPTFAVIEWRGDTGVQATRKLATVRGAYEADTGVFDPTVTVLGTALKNGDVTIGGATRRGLVAQGGSGLVLGYVTRTAATNGGRLRFIQTLV